MTKLESLIEAINRVQSWRTNGWFNIIASTNGFNHWCRRMRFEILNKI